MKKSQNPPPSPPSQMRGPPNFIFRPVRTRLLNELIRGDGDRPKTLSIVAPTGYGKTVLMSELHARLQQSGERCIWVGLDDRDASVRRVLRLLRTALTDDPGGVHPTQVLFAGEASLENRIDDLIDIINRINQPSTIFIDNLNSCTDEDLGELLDALIFRTRPNLRFIWSSTTIPGFDSSRAKLQGLLRQVTFSELSLSFDETRELIGAELGEHIGESGIEALLRQTEGWPAAVRMAQIVLQSSEQPLSALRSFSGSDEDIAALLNRQVLRGFTPELREFLLKVAQLRHFSLDLCRHALADGDAEQHLAFLSTRNVFIIPLDRNRHRYRLHGLFREFLRSEATRVLDPAALQSVLHRAADWCETREQWQDAIDYALASGDSDKASRLLDKTATIFLCDRGDHPQFIEWVDQVEAAQGSIGWEAHFWYVWALVFARRYELARGQHRKLAQRLKAYTGEGEAPPDDLSYRIDHLNIFIELFTDQLDACDNDATHWLAEATTNDPYNLATIHCLKSVCVGEAFQFADARKSLRIAEAIIIKVAGTYSQEWARLLGSLISIYEGDFIRTYEDLNQSLQRAGDALGPDSVLCDTLAFVAAKCAVEMGLDQPARLLFERGLRTAHTHGLLQTSACGFDAGIKLWTGDADDRISLAQLRQIAAGYPPRLSLMMSCYLIRRLLQLGRLNEAVIEASRIGLRFDQPADDPIETVHTARYQELFRATAIELFIATSQFKQAEALIASELPLALEQNRAARVVELRLARASIALRINRRDRAIKELVNAVGSAVRGHVLRPFRDHAATVAALVNDTRPSAWPFALNEQRTFFAAVCNSLPVAAPLKAEPVIASAGAGESPGPPTRKEIELLRLVSAGLSNEQIAGQIEASVNTVKWHLKNLFRKLGVANRAAALARARDLGLLQ